MFQNAYKPSFRPSLYAGLGRYAPVPTALGCGSDRDGAGTARPLSELQDQEPAEKFWQWQHSIQLCNTPILLMHFTLSRLNCFGLLISFSFFSSIQNFFPPFSLTKSFAICSESIATFLMLCYSPHLGLHSKKKKKQLKHFCFCSNQTKIETFCSLIQGLMCLITPFLLWIN